MSERTEELLRELIWSDIVGDYPANALYDALCERLEGRVNIEEMEIKVILDEIAERLGQRDYMEGWIVRCNAAYFKAEKIIYWMHWWLDRRECQCGSVHFCGRQERERELEEFETAWRLMREGEQ